jgi:hypothetical protein
VALDPGAYSVSETGPAGYSGTVSADCVGAIALGETKTCTVTSDDEPPAVTTCAGKTPTIVGTPRSWSVRAGAT